MDCRGTADLVTLVLSGNGTSQDDAQLRAHVASCAACAELERGLRRTWALMGQLQPLLSKAPVPAAPRASLIGKRQAMLVSAAAAILVISAAAFALFRPHPQAPSPSSAAVSTPVENPRPEQGEQEKLVNDVLNQIEIQKAPAQQPETAKQDPVETKPLAPTPEPEPKPVLVAPKPDSEPVVKPHVPSTRPEDRPAPPLVKAEPIPAPAVPVIAVLDRVEGDVVAILSGKRSPATPGAKLASGDAVETSGKTGHAVVEFADGTRLVLGADTIVDSIKIADGKRVSLRQGVLAAQVARQPAGEPMLFVTASAEARVLGTRLTLSVPPSFTRLEVREGKVKITRRDDGASVEVGANQVVQVGKGLSMTPKPVTTVRVALHETFDRRWSPVWSLGGDPNLGMKMLIENGSLSFKTAMKPTQEGGLGSGKMPTDAGEAARKAVQSAGAVASLTNKEWPRVGFLETRQAYPWSNETPLKIRTRIWNSHNDSDRVTWFAINRGVAGKGLSLERRGGSFQLWVEGATAPIWKKDAAVAQEWETLELWLSKDLLVLRRNEETLYTGANPLKVAMGTLSLGVNAKKELAQEEEARFDDVDVLLTTRAELDEVAR
jgi:ferric-dicitrate binding protein FerR (iron transport regulator)